MNFEFRSVLRNGFLPGLSVVCFVLGGVLNPFNHFLSALVLMLSAVGLYFAMVCTVAEGNWLDIRAVFTGVWLFTVGLAALRLTGYQEPWQGKTWVLLTVAYAVFQIGAGVGIAVGKKYYPSLREKVTGRAFGRVRFGLRKERLFSICLVTTAIGLICFLINIAIRGYVPCFSSSPTAYLDFHTPFNLFANAAIGVSGLCYYCLRTQPLTRLQKVCLWLCILYSVFVYPVMVVSRGNFLAAAISLTVAVFYLHRERLVALLLCLVVTFGVYEGCARLRNYSDAQLDEFFEPEQIVLPGGEDTFALSPRMAFLYGYLTVSHDNFNEAVQNLEQYTWGTRQLEPFNVILQSDWLEERNETAEEHFVRPHLNTTNLIGDFYYDFGSAGVVICLLVWSFLFGVNQGVYRKENGVLALLMLGNTMTPVLLAFFATWLSELMLWVRWGVVLLFAVAACLQVVPKKKLK